MKKNSEIDITDAYFDAEVAEEIGYIQSMADEEGMSLESYLREYYECTDEASYKETYESEIKSNLTGKLIKYAIMLQKNASISEAAFQDYLDSLSESGSGAYTYSSYDSKEKMMLDYTASLVYEDYIASLAQ